MTFALVLCSALIPDLGFAQAATGPYVSIYPTIANINIESATANGCDNPYQQSLFSELTALPVDPSDEEQVIQSGYFVLNANCDSSDKSSAEISVTDGALLESVSATLQTQATSSSSAATNTSQANFEAVVDVNPNHTGPPASIHFHIDWTVSAGGSFPLHINAACGGPCNVSFQSNKLTNNGNFQQLLTGSGSVDVVWTVPANGKVTLDLNGSDVANSDVSLSGLVHLSLATSNVVASGGVGGGAQADYLGDGKAAYTVWRATTGFWYSSDGVGGTAATQFGAPTDLPVIGDFDGDGKSDVAVFRPTTGFWYVKRSSDSEVIALQFGAATDMPVAGDYDGDGKTDRAVYRSVTGYWYIYRSSDNTIEAKQFGAATDIPVVGDFDGDGKSDIAVYRPVTGYWYILQSSTNTVVAKQWGAATDVPVSADFDGDGKTDIAVYRPSTGFWYIVRSSDGQTVAKQWGASTDVPVARDYDGDGKADIAVWRPSTGFWYVVLSTTGQTQAYQWGAPTDIAINGLTR